MTITYARETLEQVRASGVDALLKRHWEEIAHFPDIPLDVNWEAYEHAQEIGKLRAYTARADGVLIGYAAYLVNHNPHYKGSLQATQDVLYVSPQHRGGRVGYKLIAFADDELRREGVQATYQHSKLAYPIGALLERQGYELVDLLYVKRLDRNP